ncbi:MAG: flippase-like domain-containing protein [Myxococcales bacterium]|nr:flippase-like domain-containing protein [Myxococcales bacterium]
MSFFNRPVVRIGFHLAFTALGVLAVVLLVRHVGAKRLAEIFGDMAPFIVIAFLLEGLRICSDTLRMRLLYRVSGHVIRYFTLLRVQLAAYPINLLVPAGGAASEAYKVAVFKDVVGAGAATAVATVTSALVLLAGGIISIPCIFAAAYVWGLHGLTIAVIVQAVTALLLGGAMLGGARYRRLGAFMARVVRRISKRGALAIEKAQDIIMGSPPVPLPALAAAVLARAIQGLQLAIVAFGAGAAVGILPGLLAFSVQLVGGAAGDLMPAQIGATDGAFALAAEPLGIDLPPALSIAIAMHVVQLSWALIGIVGRAISNKHEAQPVSPASVPLIRRDLSP